VIAIVTDSASMLPPAWRAQLDVSVVPMSVVVDGIPYREGIEITTAEFYRRLASGADVSTSTPSPGDVFAAYQEAVDAGADGIVSIHTGSDYSAVLDAARIATREISVDVELVDTATASFPVALCVAAACDLRAAGGDLAEIAAAASATAAVVDSIFVVGVPELARRGGRLGTTEVASPTAILTLGPGGLVELATAADLDDAIERMAAHVREAASGQSLRVGVGDADRPDLGDRLAAALAGASGVVELTRYEVGPSVGAHSGPGTVGAVWAPVGPSPVT
jgi:DegV family protein with EDD domain